MLNLKTFGLIMMTGLINCADKNKPVADVVSSSVPDLNSASVVESAVVPAVSAVAPAVSAVGTVPSATPTTVTSAKATVKPVDQCAH